MLKVYGDYRSGNCYKIKLMLHLLSQPYEWVPINILRGETRSEDFLKKNPNGKIPVLELEDGSCLWESNAILNYLAEGSEFLPTDPRLQELEAYLTSTQKPLVEDSKLTALKRAVDLSTKQLTNKRLYGAQDIAWALINNPAFLFNH